MAIIKAISSKATVSKIHDYLTKEEKTEEKLISGVNCNPENMVNEFNTTKELYNKNGGVQYQHIIQSFDPKDNITPDKAHELGKELAEKQFKGYEVFVVTHKDKEHIHNHFVVNSVSYENGLKYKASNKSLWDIKRESNRICERENLKTLDLDHKANERLTSGELRKELRGEITWKGELKQCIELAKEKTKSLEEFREYLKENFDIETRVTKNSISYQHPEKEKPIRGKKLGIDYDKEELEHGFIRQKKSIDREEDRRTEEQFRDPTSTTSTPNVDWGAIERATRGQEDRLSEQSSDDIVAEIQQKVRGVKDRTDKATGEYKDPNKELTGKQRGIERENEGIARELHRRAKKRDFGLDR